MLSTPELKKLKKFLDTRVERYNRQDFIEGDPVSIPHEYYRKQDIEIAGFFTAIFSWGLRKTIINKSRILMKLMDDAPYDFCLHHYDRDLEKLMDFVHRTFNADDLLYFIAFLKHHYLKYDSLEDAFFNENVLKVGNRVESGLNHFYDYFFSLPWGMKRTRRHLACPVNKSACKRINMFLRWMVRKDSSGVDFGIWEKIKPAELICPLDVHVARVARGLSLLERKQNDWQAAVQLTESLKRLDVDDPVKYDFALFGLGIMEKY